MKNDTEVTSISAVSDSNDENNFSHKAFGNHFSANIKL